MKETEVRLVPLTEKEREQFIIDNQWAFKYGAMLEFGECDNHIDEGGEIISRKTIEECLDEAGNESYCIEHEGRIVGGMILKIDKKTQHNHLEILFVKPEEHSKGIGFSAWRAAEALHPETRIWETRTPYFEKRNIHFYVNKCGFHIVEFYNKFNQETGQNFEENEGLEEGPDEMFRFVKEMKL